MGGPSGRYHHGDLRRSLVETAIAIADEEGAAALSTRAIARRLGVSHAAPARHFRDRAELLAEVATVAFERFAEQLRDAASPKDKPEKALAKLGRAYVRFALAHPGLLRVMFSAEVAERSVAIPRLQMASASAYEALEAAVGRAMTATTSAEELRVAAFLAWSTVHGAALLWLDGPMHRPSDAQAKRQFLALADDAVDRLARTIARDR